MVAQNFTPPYPFEHRTSAEDIQTYNEAVERDEVNELIRRWSLEEEEKEALLLREQKTEHEKKVLQETLKRIAENNAENSSTQLKVKFWLTKEEAAQYLGVSTRTIDRARRDGKLKYHLLDGTTTMRFKVEDLDALMK